MTGIFEAPLGAVWTIKSGQASLLRSVRHGDTSLSVDSAQELGLHLSLNDSYSIERRIDGRINNESPRIGAIALMTPGLSARITIRGDCRGLQLRLPWTQLTSWLEADHDVDPSRVELRPVSLADDAALERLLYVARTAGHDGEEESLRAVAHHLLAHYSVSRRDGVLFETRRGGITQARVRRVAECVDANFRSPLSLSMLASEAGMSPFHFAREFKRTTGLPPHRFVVRRRVQEAIRLLPRRDLTFAETALRSGFANAGHLARQMVRITGVGPAVFRAEILP